MRTEETSCRDGDAFYHVALIDACQEVGVVVYYIGCTLLRVPLHVVCKSLFEAKVAHRIAPCIVVEQSVESDAFARTNESAYRSVWLQAATSADAHQFQLAEVRLLGAGVKVNVGESIEFVDDNIYIVAAYACGEHGDAFSLIATCDGVKFATTNITFDRVKMRGHHGHSARITHENNLFCQLLGFEMQVEYRTIVVNDKFGGSVVCAHILIPVIDFGISYLHFHAAHLSLQLLMLLFHAQ